MATQRRTGVQTSTAQTGQEPKPVCDTESERGLVYCVFSDEKAFEKAFDAIGTRWQVFYDVRHRLIYKAIVDLRLAGVAVDVISVGTKLSRFKLPNGSTAFQEYGAYFAELVTASWYPQNVDYYLRNVLSRYVARKLVAVADEIKTSAVVNVDMSAEELYADATAKVYAIQSELGALAQTQLAQLDEILLEIERDVIAAFEGKPKMGATTGYADLDKLIGGLRAPDVFIIAARPSVGKTAMLLNIAINAVERNEGFCAGIFSLEMSRHDIVTRMLCSRARVNTRFTRGASLARDEIERLSLFAARLMQYKDRICIDDRGGITISQLYASARTMVVRYGVKALFIDYLQLISSDKTHGTRNDEVAHVSHTIKAMAKDLGVPVVLLSQLNRQAARAEPSIADLRDSGTCEEDADIIGLLKSEQSMDQQIELDMVIAKNRNGPLGVVPFVFFRQYQRIELREPLWKSESDNG